MEFKKKNNDYLFEETHTSNENTISFVPYLDKIPKSIMIYTSFEFTGSMIELLHSSKVLKVDSFYNNNKQIKILPLFGFSLDKLKDILIDLCSKFNL